MNFRDLWKRRIVDPIFSLLKRGITPKQIALSIAFGVTLGIIPVLGSTTILCALAAFAFRLNLPAIQLINYLVYPLQILLLIPQYRAGEFLFNTEHLPLSLTQVTKLMKEDLWGTILFLWDTTWHAVLVWIILAPFAIAIIYYSLYPAIRRLPFNSAAQKA